MKATIVAAAAAVLAGGASAHSNHRHAHRALFEKRGGLKAERDVCVPTCTTIYSTIYGEPTWVQPPPKPTTSTVEPVIEVPTTTKEAVVVPTTTEAPAVPTTTGPPTVPEPITEICPTPGTYTFPAKTIVLTETTTVCGATSTEVPAGTHTLGGVTTVVATATTVVCPVATTETQNGVVTSVIKTTTYVCPSAGTYTIAPITTVVPSVTTVVIPVVTTYCPGTYTAPAVTTTVTQTNYVVVCPFTSEAPALAQPTSAPQEGPKEAPKEAPKPKPSTSPKPVPAGLGAKNGDLWAMTYTPFRPDGYCKTKDEVAVDVAKIKSAGFEALRIYSTDCDTLPNVGAAARENGLRLIIGIFIGRKGCDNNDPSVATQIKALKEWKQWDLVDLCVVGNEALFNDFCTVGELASLISHTKSELGSVGYTGPFTTTDVISAYQNRDVSSICSLIDVLTVNAHAYFNFETTPEKAGNFVKGQIDLAAGICGKPAYCMETGWPTAGVCNGAACPGVSQQKAALASIREVVGPKVTFFSFHDDNWKEPGACGCERSWGSSSCFGV